MTTILDVEKASGVSRSTISRYLNGKGVTEENRIKIEHAINGLSYQRNPIASGLKSSKTYTVGVVLPDITDPFFPRIIKVFQEHMMAQGYQTILNNYGNDHNTEINQVKILANKRVDGLVVATGNRNVAHIEECLSENLPVVLLDRLVEGLECDSVSVDNYFATYDAIALAIRKGHTRIGYIRGPEVYTDIVRFNGFRDALLKNGREVQEEYVVRADLVEHDAARQFMRLLNMSPPPSLIFCSNIYLALGAFEAVMEYGLKIPKEVSIMTFDRISSFPYYGFTKCSKPEFASICQPLEDIGIRTAETLLKRLSMGMENYQPMKIKLKTSFIMTDSVAEIV
jgi:LacI family transcriptional regulator